MIITNGLGSNQMLITEGYGRTSAVGKIITEILKIVSKITMLKKMESKI